jgi:hypothetical protein
MINQKWVFGRRAGLDFSTPIPTPTGGFQINAGEGCASISNANGQLLFYTDGNSVWDGTNTPRASGLLGNSSSTQSAVIVPDPADSQQYYIFTADGSTGGNNHVNGIRINVSSWASVPLSSLMAMPPTAGERSPTERVTAIQHANCVDYWVLTIVQQPVPLAAGNGPGILRVFLVNSSGVQWVGDTPMGLNVGDIGYLRASPDGLRLAVPNHPNNTVLLYNFDNSLGVIDLSSLVVITVPPATSLIPPLPSHPRAPYGVEFSPDNNVLYYSLLGNASAGGSGPVNNGYIFQVDLTAAVPSSAQTQIVVYPNPSSFTTTYALGALQLGMDGRIYVAKHGEASVGAILNPNVLGPGCAPNMSFITLQANTLCNLGLPNLLPNKCACACAETGCGEEVGEANQILNGRADGKQFTIMANGQSLPAVCDLAFDSSGFGPVFSLKWGDGSTDQFESHDFEIIYIRLHNPFRNLVYRGVKIFNIRITPNQTLPDGSDSVKIIPAEIACFDEVQPCSFVARDFALVIENALVGPYQISFDYCIEEIAIVSGRDGGAAFDIDVVAS